MQPPYPFRHARGRCVAQRVPDEGWTSDEQVARVMRKYTLIFVVDRGGRRVLLGLKKRGFGQGMYNGFGGKPDPGESMMECAQRELEEESGLQTNALNPCGRLVVTEPHGQETVDIDIFCCDAWKGTAEETDEMVPRWFELDELPYDQMWPEAAIFVPPLLDSIMQRRAELLLARAEYHQTLVGWWVGFTDTNAF